MSRGNLEIANRLIVMRECDQKVRQRVYRAYCREKNLRLAQGVYIDSNYYHELPFWDQHRLRALACGASRVRIVAGISAAMLWEMWVIANPATPVEYYLARSRKEQETQGRRLSGALSEDDYLAGARVCVTTRARTIFDLANIHGYQTCFVAASSVLAQSSETMEELATFADRSETLARVLRDVDTRVESPAEAAFLAQVCEEGIIRVIPQVSIIDGRGTMRRADFQIHKTNVLVEVSGLGKYGTTETDQRYRVDRAAERLDALATAGYRIWAYSAQQVFSGEAYRDVRRRYLAAREAGYPLYPRLE